ncbi:MAG: response regulator transcription factor [Clostridia bacterium]|nr:response regulator transcription factor [Clostridia bacterium]
MRVAIVDDDNELLDSLSGLISNELLAIGDSSKRISKFNSGEAFLEVFKAGDFDLIVLDIFMGGILGIDVARKIRESDNDARIVFCTTSNEFASESYEVNAHYYLHKPFTEKSVKSMLDRLNLDSYEVAKHITLSNGQSVILRNVIYTEYFGHSVTIHCKRGEDISARVLHSEVESLLCENSYFSCCTKGVIVNFHEVKSLNGNDFLMSNGDLVPISRRKSKDVIDAYSKFKFDQLRKEALK